jgi:RHS repeat-associated protein
VTVTGTNSSTGAVYGTATRAINAPPPPPQVAVTPAAGTLAVAAGQTASTPFTVQNTGYVSASVTFSATCSGTGLVSPCSPGTQSASLAPGGSATVNVSVTGTAAAGTGTVTLTATNGAGAGSWSGSRAVNTMQVAINPSGTLTLGYGQSGTASFTVQNSGGGSVSLALAGSCSGPGLVVTPCSASPASLTLAAGASAPVSVAIQGSAVGGSGTITLTGTNQTGPGQWSGARTLSVTSPPQMAITPAAGTLNLSTGTSLTTAFTVANTGTVPVNVALTGQCTGALAATPCSPSTTPLSLAAGASTSISVTIQASASPGAGAVTLTARNNAGSESWQGTRQVSVALAAPFDVANFHGGTTIERGFCPTVAIVPDAASQCGALRISHGLPATTAFGKSYAPTLAYFSDHTLAPQVAVKVALNGGPAPDSVAINTYAVDAANNRTLLLAARFGNAVWAQSDSQRFNTGLLWTDGGHATGIYTFDVEVQLKTAGAWTTQGSAQRGKVAWVNRDGSPFGNGWWLLGLEELYTQQDGSILWVGGDGSTRRYTAAVTRGDTTAYGTPSLMRPDSLYRSNSTGWWRRALPNRVNVYFDELGRHRQTVNTYGRTTQFAYDATAGRGRLQSITIPGGQQTTFQYASTGVTVTSPGGRTTQLAFGTQANAITRITDPDLTYVGFQYFSGRADQGSRSNLAISGRTDRRGTTTTFYWGGYTSALVIATTPIDATHTAQLGFASPRGRAAYRATDQPVGAGQPSYEFDGPRTDLYDATRIWTDTLGAVQKIVDAAGRTTTVGRSTSFPALASRVVAPGGYEERSYYDVRGHVDSTIALNPYGDGRNAATRYTWNQTWDAITSVTGPEGETTLFAVDPATGNRTSEERSQVPGSRVEYHYHPTFTGLIRSVHTPIVSGGFSVDSLEYDSFGNLTKMISPRARVARFARDGIGRVTSDTTYLTVSTSGPKRVHSTQYDAMDRPVVQIDSAGSDALEVRTFYNAAGAPDSVNQWARPVRVARDYGPANAPIRRSYAYDLLGRKLFEYGGGVEEGSWRYDAAGNVVASSRESGDSLVYDALNRLVQRVGGPDSARYTYDALGNLQEATNTFAKIRRSYYRNGALRGDTTSIANSTLTGFGSTDGFTVQYDLAGRRTAVQMPAGVDGRTISYTYDAGASGTGQVATITDGFSGKANTFQYDVLGRPSIITRYANAAQSIVETRAYDSESNDTLRTIVGGSTTYLNEHVRYDLLNRIVRVAGADTNAYDGLGHAVYSINGLQPIGTSSSITYDAFGNRVLSSTMGGPATSEDRSFVYQGGFNRAVKEWKSSFEYYPDTTYSWYGGAGGALAGQQTMHIFSFPSVYPSNDSGYVDTRRGNGYRGGKMVSSAWYQDTVWIFRSTVAPVPPAYENIETYRYDALGRRAWQRMVYPDDRCDRVETNSGCLSSIISTVWDGSNILLERRTSSDTGYVGPVPANPFGVVAYVPGLEIDRPFLVLRQGWHDVQPFTSVSGRITTGACAGTPCDSADVTFPMGKSDLFGRQYGVRDHSNWYGSLIQGMVDGSGYIYQRNRYLNPKTGTFTQTDPIGLAGGMNVYGFAGGDPVNYSDPFGLCPEFLDGVPCKVGFAGLNVSATIWGMNVSASVGLYGGDGYSGIYGNFAGGVEKGRSPKTMSGESLLPSVSANLEFGGNDSIEGFDGHSDQAYVTGGAGGYAGSVSRSWNASGKGFTVSVGKSTSPSLGVGLQGSNTKLLTKRRLVERPVEIRAQVDATEVRK